MKLKKMALLAEIVASLAVVVSLGLLILEVRDNTMAIERQLSMNHYRQIFTPFLHPPVLISAMQKIRAADGQTDYVQAFKSEYGMDDAEAYVWGNFLLTIWADMQEDFGSNGPSERLAEQIRHLVINPDIKLFVEHFQFSEAFESYIHSVMSDIDSK